MVAIKIGGSLDYQKQVIGVLNAVAKNPVGSVITGFVLKHKYLVKIDPLDKGKAAVYGDDNAITTGINARDGAPKGVSERGPNYWYMGKEDNLYTRLDDERFDMVPKATGTGVGSAVVIKYSPDKITNNRVWDRQADNVLVHELVHALRVMYGLMNAVPTKDPSWKNEEEFLAVAVQNVYLSAGGFTRLRDGYTYETLMAAPKDTSSGFLDHDTTYNGDPVKANLEIFSKHAKPWGQIYTELAMVKTATFNPFREFVARSM